MQVEIALYGLKKYDISSNSGTYNMSGSIKQVKHGCFAICDGLLINTTCITSRGTLKNHNV